ncbi:MAG TPA: DUF1697 domain-containing protein [Bacteroidota bacterium]|nr:DUF1697 domain-containing protein [Bacteroidota bacterium]
MVYIAMLRGINVSGQKIIKMEDLKKAFEAMHFERVTTYIQSGNVIFDSPAADPGQLQTQIRNKLLKSFGFEIPVVIRTVDELEGVTKRNPFKKVNADKGENLYVSFLSEKPGKAGERELERVKSDVDDLRLSGNEAYILCRKSYAKTVFSNTLIEKKLGVASTTRNWNSVQKLLSIAKTGK